MKKLLCLLLSCLLAFSAPAVVIAGAEDSQDVSAPRNENLLSAPGPQVKGILGHITEALAEKTKDIVEKEIILSLEDMADEGSETANGLLGLFYSATDYTINEIYEISKETLETVNEIDDEMDALTVRVEELYAEIQKGFAQNAYNDAARDLDAAYSRIQPLWQMYTKILDATSPDLPVAKRLSEVELRTYTDDLMKAVRQTYGSVSGETSFKSDFSLIHNAMYSPSGRTTFTDAQIALSRLELPFEHQVNEPARAAFNYGAALETMLLRLYQEYAGYVLSNADPSTPHDPQADAFADTGNQVIRNLNTQAEGCDVFNLMQPDAIETTIQLKSGDELPAYHVIVNADRHEYMIGRDTIQLRHTYMAYGTSDGTNQQHCDPTHEDELFTADGRWYIPPTETEMKTLFTPTITNPGSWLSDSGGLSLPQHDALMLADVNHVSEDAHKMDLNTYESFDQGLLDSHHLTGDSDKITLNSYHDLYKKERKIKWTSRSAEIECEDTEALCVFFDKHNQSGGIPVDDNGYLAPSDPTTLPGEVYLADGDGINLTKLGSTDLLGKTITVSGNVTILGGGRTYQNVQLRLEENARLTIDHLNIDQQNRSLSACDVWGSNAEMTVVGPCTFRGGSGLYFQNSQLTVYPGDDTASLALDGDTGVNTYFDQPNGSDLVCHDLSLTIHGSQYGVHGFNFGGIFYNCNVAIDGGSIDICGGDPNGHDWYKYSNILCTDTSITTAHNTRQNGFISLDHSTYNYDTPYKLDIRTGDGKNNKSSSDIYFSITGRDQWDNTVTTNQVNITDMAGGDHFGKAGTDIIYPVLNRYIWSIDYISLVNTGDDAWYPRAIFIENYLEADPYYHSVYIDAWVETKNYEYRFAPASSPDSTDVYLSDERTISLLEAGKTPGLLTMNAKPEYAVSPKIFEALNRLNQALCYNILDEDNDLLYSWLFEGDTLSRTGIAASLGIDIEKISGIDGSGLPALTGKNGLLLHFDHEGDLPGPSRVRINMTKQGYTTGETFGLFRLSEDGKTLEPVAQNLTVDEQGFVTITLDHCSDYALIKTGIGNLAPQTTANPKTGTPAEPWLWGALMLLCAGAGLALYKGRKSL